jgi:hypothetical protein
VATEQEFSGKGSKIRRELEDMILQRLLIGGVFVSVRRDPILGWRPTVITAPKHTKNAQELEIVRESNYPAIKDERPMGMVRDNAVVLELKSVHPARPNQLLQLVARRPSQAGRLLRNFLQRFKDCHGRLIAV